MIWWKEWRETRFSFIVTLVFLSGLYYSVPARHRVDTYWLGVFLAFFGMATAIVLGSSAVASEVTAGTMAFLISKPARRARFLSVKYVVRAVEVIALFAVPMAFLIDWRDASGWAWAAPYLAQQYLLVAVLMVVFTYSGSFFFSVLFRRQWLGVLASIGLLASYFSARGMSVLMDIYGEHRIERDLWFLLLASLALFGASLLVFRKREF